MLYVGWKFTKELDSIWDHFFKKVAKNGTKNWAKIVPSWNPKSCQSASSAESKCRILGL
jgi:hypothetical protein